MVAQAELVVLGGAFFVNGNVNPAAEANIFGDPDAADIVFGGAGLQSALLFSEGALAESPMCDLSLVQVLRTDSLHAELASTIFSPGCPNVRVVGLDVTHEVVMEGKQLDQLEGRGQFGSFLHKISRFYLQYHRCGACTWVVCVTVLDDCHGVEAVGCCSSDPSVRLLPCAHGCAQRKV